MYTQLFEACGNSGHTLAVHYGDARFESGPENWLHQ
jgi:hypothetical protein